ncbi:hypothetical protein TrRE_jg11708, partial [Triparma retinervis]
MPQSSHLSCGNEEKVPQVLTAWGGQEEVEENPTRQAFSDTFEAAALAATFTGGFEPASFSGAGMTAPSTNAINGHLDARQSGIVYTPPTYSDHVAVVCHFKFEADEERGQGGGEELAKDKGTKECQPHRAQKSLAGFFGGGGGGWGGGAGKKSSMFATSAVKAKGKEGSNNSLFKNSRASNASCGGEAGGAKKKKSVFKTTTVGNKRGKHNSEKTLSSFYPVKKRKSHVPNVTFGRDQQAEPEDKEDNGGTEGV